MNCCHDRSGESLSGRPWPAGRPDDTGLQSGLIPSAFREEMMMFDLIKKTMLMGVGLAVMSKEKAAALAKEIADSAQLSSEKGQEFVKEVVGKSEKAKKDLEETIQKFVNEGLKRTNLPTREDFAALQARMEALEGKIEKHSH
jgi:polyhydroxyalkanoate synthesis regulator phasin